LNGQHPKLEQAAGYSSRNVQERLSGQVLIVENTSCASRTLLRNILPALGKSLRDLP
jgi:hypothetical protein